MLVTCVECGNATSDTAAQCPKCESPREVFLGKPASCHECGFPFAPAYAACPECGAPSVHRSISQKDVKQKDQTLIPVSGDPPVNPPGGIQSSNGPEPAAPIERHDEQAGEPVYIKLTPLRDFGGSLQFWLLAFATVKIGEGLQLGAVLWVTTPSYQGGPDPRLATQWLSLLAYVGSLLSVARIVCLALCAYFYSRFIFRGLKNLRPVSGGNTTYSPTWGVVMQFIPVVNLFGVFAMSDVWNGSHFVAKRPAAANGLIGTWWTFWIGATLLTAASSLLLDYPAQYARAVIAAIGASLAYLIAALLLRTVVGKIADAHDSARILLARRVPNQQTDQQGLDSSGA